MAAGQFERRRVLVMQCDDDMGPPIVARFREEGADVTAVPGRIVEASAIDALVETERFQKSLARNVPIGRLAQPEESADLALFLASPHSDFIVGQVVPFAGGWTTTPG